MNDFLKNLIYSTLPDHIINRGKKGAIYITFDDGPHPENTPKILNILEKTNAKATFFMTGSEMERFPEIVKSVVDQGHSIGYHSYSHSSYKKISLKTIRDELSIGKVLASKAGININLFRPAYGDLTVLSFLYLILTGWKIVMWSLDSRDSFDTKDQVIKTVDISKLADGDILLFHDDYQLTLDILPEIMENFHRNNIQCKGL